MNLISIQKADELIAKNIKPFKHVRVPLEKAYGAVLHEDIKADRDLPPYDKSLMDGIAIAKKSFDLGVTKFPIENAQYAGQPQRKLTFKHSCIEIATGAVIPKGCDTIIPVELIDIVDGKAMLKNDIDVSKGQYIKKQASDYKKGTVLVKKGCRLNPPQIAVATSVGKTPIKVGVKPKVAAIATGDELVNIDVKPKDYQIRKSNSYFIKVALEKTGLFDARRFHFVDDPKILKKQIGAILAEFDAVVLTGGVSMGKKDYVPAVLKDLGVTMVFHKVKQKPGKPFWFGKSRDGKVVFALPGNPVSTQVGTYRHVIPQLTQALGIVPEKEFAILNKAVNIDTAFTFFLPVTLKSTREGALKATPILTGGSSDFATMGQSDGFMEIPANTKKVKPGFVGQIYRW